MKELEETNPANEAEGQNTTSASCTKLLENGRDSENSTARESSTDVDVDDVDLDISSFWLHELASSRRSVSWKQRDKRRAKKNNKKRGRGSFLSRAFFKFFSRAIYRAALN